MIDHDRSGPHGPAIAIERTTAVGSVLFAAVLFGTAGTARELGPDGASSLSVGAVRIVLGVLVLWAVVAGGARRRHEPIGVSRTVRRHWPTILVGGLGVVAYTPMFFVAVDRVGVAIGTVVTIASGPFFAGAIEWILQREPPSSQWFVGTAITVVGAAVLVVSSDTGGVALDAGGIAAALTAGLGYAVYSVSSKATIEHGAPSTLALAMPFSVGAVGVVVLASGESLGWLASVDGAAMGLYLGVAATGVAYVLFGRGLRSLTSSTAVTLVLAEPVTAALLATVVLDESIPPIGWLGLASVVGGLWVVGQAVTAQDVSSSADGPTLR